MKAHYQVNFKAFEEVIGACSQKDIENLEQPLNKFYQHPANKIGIVIKTDDMLNVCIEGAHVLSEDMSPKLPKFLNRKGFNGKYLFDIKREILIADLTRKKYLGDDCWSYFPPKTGFYTLAGNDVFRHKKFVKIWSIGYIPILLFFQGMSRSYINPSPAKPTKEGMNLFVDYTANELNAPYLKKRFTNSYVDCLKPSGENPFSTNLHTSLLLEALSLGEPLEKEQYPIILPKDANVEMTLSEYLDEKYPLPANVSAKLDIDVELTFPVSIIHAQGTTLFFYEKKDKWLTEPRIRKDPHFKDFPGFVLVMGMEELDE